MGRALLRLLVPAADEVRVLVRRPEDDESIRGLGAEPVRGDLVPHGGCRRLVRDGDVIFHAAARVDVAGRWKEFRAATVEGTRRLLKQALPLKPRRFVYAGSAAVYSPADDGGVLSAERTPARPPPYNYYARAKLEAERIVRAECDRAGCPWTILRLAFLYGPGNRTLASTFATLVERDHLFLIGPGDNHIAALYVDDAARALVLAATHPAAAGRIYDVASEEPVTQRTFVEGHADALGLPRPGRQVSFKLAYASAYIAELAGRLPGVQPKLNRAVVALMSADQRLDASRIRQELGWEPEVSFADGLRHTKEWYDSQERSRRAACPGDRLDAMRRPS